MARWISEDPAGLQAGLNLYSYVENAPTELVDRDGLSGSNPGGPYHEPEGVKLKCTWADDCSTLKGKMYLLEKKIKSHEGWDRHQGTGRHAVEIAELYAAWAKCKAIYTAKCDPPKVPECKRCPSDVAAVLTGALLMCMIGALAFP